MLGIVVIMVIEFFFIYILWFFGKVDIWFVI